MEDTYYIISLEKKINFINVCLKLIFLSKYFKFTLSEKTMIL